MNNNQIFKIFRKLGYKVTSIKDSSKGVDQNVKIVSTNSGKYVIKIPHKEKDKISNELIATEHCGKIKIPVPKVLYHDKNILIETYIEGKDIGNIRATKEEYKKIYYQLGEILRKIHSIKCTGFGPIKPLTLKGKYKTQKELMESHMKKDLENLKNTQYYSDADFKKILKYYKLNKPLLNAKKSALLHMDFEEGNILIKNKKITGIIDFGDLTAGPPMQDIARLYVYHYRDYKFNEFLRGYKKHNLKEIQFYAFCFMTWRITSYIKHNKRHKRFRIAVNRYKELWSGLI